MKDVTVLFDFDSHLYHSVYRIVSIADMKALLRAYELPYPERKQKAFDYIVDEAFSRMGAKTLKIFDAIEATAIQLGSFEYYITYCKRSVIKEISEYSKSNRKPNKWVSSLRKKLIEEGTALFHDEYEADDLIADRAKELRAQNKAYIIVSIDKDLKQLPGYHFDFYPIYSTNPETGEKIFVRLKGLSFTSDFEAMYMLATQLLTGDSGDRIKGLHRVGAKSAEKILKDCKTPYSFFRCVVSEYIKRHSDTFDWRIELMTNYRLIKLGTNLSL